MEYIKIIQKLNFNSYENNFPIKILRTIYETVGIAFPFESIHDAIQYLIPIKNCNENGIFVIISDLHSDLKTYGIVTNFKKQEFYSLYFKKIIYFKDLKNKKYQYFKPPSKNITLQYIRDKNWKFHFQDFTYQMKNKYCDIKFHFHFNHTIHFKPTSKIYFPTDNTPIYSQFEKQYIDNLIFNIGMIELISYWKSFCCKEIIIHPFRLNKKQIQWWKKLYFNGLGEFMYLNHFNFNEENFVTIQNYKDSLSISYQKEKIPRSSLQKVLIPIGGGKDSITTVSLIKKMNLESYFFLMNPIESAKKTVEYYCINTNKQVIEIKRNIDNQLLELNKRGYFNGHTPFSAILAFYSTLCACLMGIKYIALSNESSANEPTIPNTKINHQYSKSFEFEKNFQEYEQDNLNTNTSYFSFLRPLNERQIIQIFTKKMDHIKIFKSCNIGSKQNIWCGSCSKCLFVYLMLCAEVGNKITESIFGDNLLNNPELKNIFLELIGKSHKKPFECIGTIEECNIAVSEIINQDKKNHSFLCIEFYLEHFSDDIKSESEIKNFKQRFHIPNLLEPKFESIIRNEINL